MFIYTPLFITLAEKGMNKKELLKLTGISTRTLARITQDESKRKDVSLEVINRICNVLEVPIEKVIKHVPD